MIKTMIIMLHHELAIKFPEQVMHVSETGIWVSHGLGYFRIRAHSDKITIHTPAGVNITIHYEDPDMLDKITHHILSNEL